MKYQNLLVELDRRFGKDKWFMLSDVLPLYANCYSHTQGDIYRLWKMRLIKRSRMKETGLRGIQYAYTFTAWGKKHLNWIADEKSRIAAQKRQEDFEKTIKQAADMKKERDELIITLALSKNPNRLELSKLTLKEMMKYDILRDFFKRMKMV